MEMAKNKISSAQDLNFCQLNVINYEPLFFLFGLAHKPKFGLFLRIYFDFFSRSLFFPIAVLFIGSFVAHFIFFFSHVFANLQTLAFLSLLLAYWSSLLKVRIYLFCVLNMGVLK